MPSPVARLLADLEAALRALGVRWYLGGPGLEDHFLARAVRREVEGVQVPVASPEDIVIMKLLDARPKDLEDVVALLSSHHHVLDLDYVRATLGALEQALGQSALRPALAAAAARAQRR